jgi:hypothetical protein
MSFQAGSSGSRVRGETKEGLYCVVCHPKADGSTLGTIRELMRRGKPLCAYAQYMITFYEDTKTNTSSMDERFALYDPPMMCRVTASSRDYDPSDVDSDEGPDYLADLDPVSRALLCDVASGRVPSPSVASGPSPSVASDRGPSPSVTSGRVPSPSVASGRVPSPSGASDRGPLPSDVDSDEGPDYLADLDPVSRALLCDVASGRVPSPSVASGPSPSARASDRGPLPSARASDRGPLPSARASDRGPSPSGASDRGPSPSGASDRGPSPSGASDRGPSPSGASDRGPSPSARASDEEKTTIRFGSGSLGWSPYSGDNGANASLRSVPVSLRDEEAAKWFATIRAGGADHVGPSATSRAGGADETTLGFGFSQAESDAQRHVGIVGDSCHQSQPKRVANVRSRVEGKDESSKVKTPSRNYGGGNTPVHHASERARIAVHGTVASGANSPVFRGLSHPAYPNSPGPRPGFGTSCVPEFDENSVATSFPSPRASVHASPTGVHATTLPSPRDGARASPRPANVHASTTGVHTTTFPSPRGGVNTSPSSGFGTGCVPDFGENSVATSFPSPRASTTQENSSVEYTRALEGNTIGLYDPAPAPRPASRSSNRYPGRFVDHSMYRVPCPAPRHKSRPEPRPEHSNTFICFCGFTRRKDSASCLKCELRH